MTIDGVEVQTNLPAFTVEEGRRYIEYVRARVPEQLKKIIVTQCADGKVDVSYVAEGEPFERIRRVTGYLTGDTRHWNDAKQAEERERVKHAGWDLLLSE